jgi:hypothetical protein
MKPMTAAEWLTCQEPQRMLELLRERGQLTERQARLFGIACCRQVWRYLADERSRNAVRVAEGAADGLLDEAAWEAARSAARTVYCKYDVEHLTLLCAAEAVYQLFSHVARSAEAAADSAAAASGGIVHRPTFLAEQGFQASLLRDIFRNPFYPPAAIDPIWLTWDNGIVRRLAEDAYEHRVLPSGHLDPVRLGVLADALEEARADASLLEHLRGPGPHVRGCHIVDYLTGRGT